MHEVRRVEDVGNVAAALQSVARRSDRPGCPDGLSSEVIANYGPDSERVSVQDADRAAREALATRGLDVVEVGRPFEAAISRRPDVFGAPKPPVAEGVTRS